MKRLISFFSKWKTNRESHAEAAKSDLAEAYLNHAVAFLRKHRGDDVTLTALALWADLIYDQMCEEGGVHVIPSH